ncbi:MAG: hypothetical protein R3B45_10780 [Bdellovibrionota bacterium]
MKAAILTLIMLSSCAHKVYSLSIEDDERTEIRNSLHRICSVKDCQLGECWREREGGILCEIEYSFVSALSQEEIMRQVAKVHGSKEYLLGFCGRNSYATQFTGSFFRGVGAGMVSGSFGKISAPLSVFIAAVSTRADANFSDSESVDIYEACSKERTRVLE